MKRFWRVAGSAGGAEVGCSGLRKWSSVFLRLRSRPTARPAVWRKWRAAVRGVGEGERRRMSSIKACSEVWGWGARMADKGKRIRLA